MNDSKERRKKKGEGERLEDKTPITTAESSAISLLQKTQLLKIIKDILHNKIKQKKEQVHKTENIAENDRLSI